MDVIIFDDRPILLIFLVKDFGVQEVFKQLVKPLETSIGEDANLHYHKTYLLTSVFFPVVVVECGIESFERLSVNKIDETVTNIALVLRYGRGFTLKSQGRYKKS